MPRVIAKYDKSQYPFAEEVTRFTINRNDILHLKNLYALLHEWMVEHEYGSREDFKFPETYLLHREGPAGKEMWWRWRGERDPMHGNKLWRFHLNVDCHVLTMKDVEVAIGGKKYKAQQGEVEVQGAGRLLFDPGKTLEKSMFKDMKKLLLKRLWKQQYEMLKDDLRRDVFQFRDAVATFLTIETYLPEKEWPEFWPKRIPES
jgi:hypothetical protein